MIRGLRARLREPRRRGVHLPPVHHVYGIEGEIVTICCGRRLEDLPPGHRATIFGEAATCRGPDHPPLLHERRY